MNIPIEIKQFPDISWSEFSAIDQKIFSDEPLKESAFADLKKKGLYFATKNGNIIGYIYMKVFGTLGQIARYGSTIDFRHQGIGKKLFSFALDWLRRQGCTEAFLLCEEHFVPALILHSQFEFKSEKAVYQFKIPFEQLTRVKQSIELRADYEAKALTLAECEPFVKKYRLITEQLKIYANSVEKNLLLGLYLDNTPRGFCRFTPTFPGAFPIFVSYTRDVYPFLDHIEKKWALKDYDYIILTFEDQVTLYKELKKYEFPEMRKLFLQKRKL